MPPKSATSNENSTQIAQNTSHSKSVPVDINQVMPGLCCGSNLRLMREMAVAVHACRPSRHDRATVAGL